MPKIVNHEERRAAIAAAVLRVIARDGVRGADIRTVAAEAGWSTGVIAHYFGDKQNLLLGALRAAMAHVAVAMGAITGARAGPDLLLAMLEAGMPLDAERAASCRIFYHFAAEGMNDPRLASELAGYYDWWRRETADVIEDCQRQGRFLGRDPAALAEILVGLAEGLAIQAVFATPPIPDLSARLREAVRAFDVAPVRA